MIKRLLITPFVALVITTSAWAQLQTGNLYGTAVDNEGAGDPEGDRCEIVSGGSAVTTAIGAIRISCAEGGSLSANITSTEMTVNPNRPNFLLVDMIAGSEGPRIRARLALNLRDLRRSKLICEAVPSSSLDCNVEAAVRGSLKQGIITQGIINQGGN